MQIARSEGRQSATERFLERFDFNDRNPIYPYTQVAGSQIMSDQPSAERNHDYINPSDAAERAVLGAILHDAGLINIVADIIEPADFAMSKYAGVFRTMLALYQRNLPPDVVMLAGEDPEIDTAFLADLMVEVQGLAYVEHYCHEIAKFSRVRKMQDIGARVALEATRGNFAAVKQLTAALDLLTEDTKERRRLAFNTISAIDLATVALPAPRMLVESVWPEGFAMLAGRAKIGKSFFVLNIALAIASGGKALGRCDVLPGDVLYLALEDTRSRLQQRMNAMLCGSPPPVGLDYVTESPRANEGGIEMIETWIDSHPDARAVAVDTLGRFRSNGNGGKTNAFDADYATMIELKDVCDRHPGVSLLAVHHQNKRVDHADPFDSVSGTGALAAGPDTVLIFERKRGQNEGTLYGRGRDLDECHYGLSFDPVTFCWGITGTAEEARMSREQREIISALNELGKDASPKEIMDTLERVGEVARVSTQNQLRKMVTTGFLLHANGKYRPSKVKTLPPLTHSTTTNTDYSSYSDYTDYTDDSDYTQAQTTGVIDVDAVTAVIGVITTPQDEQSPEDTDEVPF